MEGIFIAALAVLLFVIVYYMAAKRTDRELALAAALGASGLVLGAGSLLITSESAAKTGGGQKRKSRKSQKQPHPLAAKAKFTKSEAAAARALANGDPLPFPPPADYAGAKSESTPTPPTLPYRARGGVPVARTHVGQRKLALAEVDFLSRNAHLSRTVVYAGAGPGIHFPVIARLFPEHRFILYDLTPYEFADLSSARQKQFRLDAESAASVMSRIDARVGYFTDETAAELADEFDGDVLFISDIRTGSSSLKPGISVEARRKKERAFEEQVMENQTAQLRWAETMGFRAAQLKFRLPYGIGDGGGKYAEGSKYEYADGIAYLQAYPPLCSTETRLEVAGPIAPGETVPRKLWDRAEYDDVMFYHNNIRREFGDYESVVEGESAKLGTSYDNAREVDIWLGYLSYAAGASHEDPGGFSWLDPESGGPVALAAYLSAIIRRGLPACKSGVRAVDRRANCWSPEERKLLKAAGAPLGLP